MVKIKKGGMMTEGDLARYRNAVWKLIRSADNAQINTNEVKNMDDILFDNHQNTNPPCSCLDPWGFL